MSAGPGQAELAAAVRPARRYGLGLRTQIVAALSATFIVSFALVGVATVQLAQRARSLERLAGARALAEGLAATLDSDRVGRREGSAAAARAVVGASGIAGLSIQWPGLEPHVHGTQTGDEVAAVMARGGEVRLWVRRPSASDGAPLTNLLLLYVSVTAGAILLLTFVALTYLIVRPLSAVTRASERLAAGHHVPVPVRGAAEVARLAVAFNDMAAQLKADRSELESRVVELTRTTDALDSARDQVLRSERLASVGRLSAGVAHEIGNPLAAILGFVELLGDAKLAEPERSEYLRRVQHEIERIQTIIRDLLDFSRQTDSGETAGADLGQVIEGARALVGPQRNLRDVRIQIELAEGIPLVRGSADRLTQVVLNLLLNAGDALEGEGQVTVRAVHDEANGQVVLTVEDDGPGFAADVMDTLFEPFVTTKPVGQGTGLGLAVSYTIVEHLGGTLIARNREGGGACIQATLPVASR